MRKLFTALALVVLAVPTLATAEMQKAKTIDELAKMFDSTSCKECHDTIYAQWEKSHHARTFTGVAGGMMLTPVVTSSVFKVAKPEDATLKTFPCFKCHLPQALRWAEDSVAKELAAALMANPQDKAKVQKLQITCKVCHWEKAIVHKLVEGQPKEGVIYGSKAGAHDAKDYPNVAKSVILKQAIFCGQCHGTGPNFEFDYPVQCATLYGSYQHNYLSNGGLATCQECHMQQKDWVADHLIAPNFDDKEATQKLLASSINLTASTIGYQWLRKAGTHIPKVVVNTQVTHNAGHRIPDGWPSHNRVVMVVTAKSADGKFEKTIEKHYHTQATTCRDEKMAYGAQNKTSYFRDTSLQPFKVNDESFEFDLPYETKENVNTPTVRTVDVTIELNYEIQNPDNKITIHKVSKTVTLDR